MDYKENSGKESEKEKTESSKESLSLLRDFLSTPEQMLVEIWMVKAILMRFQKNLRSIGNWKKGDLHTEWQRARLYHVQVLVF